MFKVFIAGTGTNIGKTATCGLMMRLLTPYMPHLYYWKVIQTGLDNDTDKVRELSQLPDSHFLQPYASFKDPLSPHLAAEIEEKKIDTDELIKAYEQHATRCDVILEGAGGLCVPLNRSYYTWLDFIRDTKVPVILVASTELGTINHTMLSVKALESINATLLGIVFYGGLSNKDNIVTICSMSNKACLTQFDLKSENISQIHRKEFVDFLINYKNTKQL